MFCFHQRMIPVDILLISNNSGQNRNRKTRSAISEIQETEQGVSRGKTANIWKSFQLWRKEAKHRDHYFNFLQFSALRDAQEILYANSFLKNLKNLSKLKRSKYGLQLVCLFFFPVLQNKLHVFPLTQELTSSKPLRK